MIATGTGKELKATLKDVLEDDVIRALDNLARKSKGIRSFNFELTKMDDFYKLEETGKGWCRPSKVNYFDEVKRKEYELFIEDGKLFDSKGKLFDTNKSSTAFSSGKAIFVVSEDGRIFASNYHRIGELHHSSFLAGKPIACAGEILVKEGIIKIITRKSGHYTPEEISNIQFKELLDLSGVNTAIIKFERGF